jgi:hypothetical protein
LNAHLPETRVRDELNLPLMLPSTSVVVPSSLRSVSRPNEAPNFPDLLTVSRSKKSGVMMMPPAAQVMRTAIVARATCLPFPAVSMTIGKSWDVVPPNATPGAGAFRAAEGGTTARQV